MFEIEKNYNPNEIEISCYKDWEKAGYFACNYESNELPYTIMLPPPNVTGTLHMGHGFQHTIMDILVRYHRMNKHDTLWQPGTDHAGIATQMVVERELNSKQITKHDLGREEFIKEIWKWKEVSGSNISKQMRRLGISPDWSRECFTMDEKLSKAVTQCFIRLYEDGLAYKGERLVNWDPQLKTAVSDLEVVQESENGFLWHFIYPVSESDEKMIVATTRPETMLGDAAVAVNPNDARYKHLIGKKITLPLVGRQIPIIADEYVDIEFGTGCVKITPAHDFNDNEIGKRHNLPMINVLNDDATINFKDIERYNGLDRMAARKIIIDDMQNAGLLDKIEPHELKVPRGDRSGVVIEPYITKQWFIKTKSLAKPALEAVQNKEVRFIPDNWKNTYYSWMNDIQDWCISRQIWWGHRIPVWYDKEGNIYVAENEDQAREKYNIPAEVSLEQDTDVFDTWFSSALWPFSTLGWPENTKELKKYYPTSTLVTGFDIIFFWVARMMMFGIYFMGEAPFKDIYITGLIRDAEGQKMSKSKGNVLDPVDLIDGIDLESLIAKKTSSLMQPKMKAKIEKSTRKEFPNGINAYGADALRFTYAALATSSRDICFDTARTEGYRNFCNKLWNATRFIMMNLEDYNPSNKKVFGITETWIWHSLNKTIAEVHKNMADYRFDLVASNIYEFVWNEYCDWYLEFAKTSLNDSATSNESKQGIRYTLINILDNILRLAHPIIPYITESLYQQIKPLLGESKKSIMVSSYPVFICDLENIEAQNDINWLKNVISAIRVLRSEMNIKPSVKVPLYITNVTDIYSKNLNRMNSLICSMAKIDDIILTGECPVSSSTVVDGVEFNIPLAGFIDVSSEKLKLIREQEKIDIDIKKLQDKLSNDRFVSNAPSDVVEGEKDKLSALFVKHTIIKQQFDKLSSLG